MDRRRFLQGVPLAVASWSIGPEPKKLASDLTESARKALQGFMIHNPEALPGTDGYYRCYFDVSILPKPTRVHDPWDLGDCTGRAIRAWIRLREMLGDYKTGSAVEQGHQCRALGP